MSGVVTLTTDFGASDGYVASMKGVILGVNPRARIIDITHAIEPQSIVQASFVLHTSWRYFPEGTVHISVIDPGVGSRRKAVILKTPSALFVTPDNGTLSYVLQELWSGKAPKGAALPAAGTSGVAVPPDCEAVEITREEYWRQPVSSTFHGRDIFAPVAAHLSMDMAIHEFGEPIEGLVAFPVPVPFKDGTGQIIGQIIHIDRFGNLITNLRAEDIPAGGAGVEIRNQRINSMSSYYAAGKGLMAVVGSTDYLELSIKEGSAAAFLGARVGDSVKITKPPLR